MSIQKTGKKMMEFATAFSIILMIVLFYFLYKDTQKVIDRNGGVAGFTKE